MEPAPASLGSEPTFLCARKPTLISGETKNHFFETKHVHFKYKSSTLKHTARANCHETHEVKYLSANGRPIQDLNHSFSELQCSLDLNVQRDLNEEVFGEVYVS